MTSLPPFRLAIPKKGRLYEKCSKVLEGAGLEYRREARLDVSPDYLLATLKRTLKSCWNIELNCEQSIAVTCYPR